MLFCCAFASPPRCFVNVVSAQCLRYFPADFLPKMIGGGAHGIFQAVCFRTPACCTCDFLQGDFLPIIIARCACDLVQARLLPIMFARGACDFLRAGILTIMFPRGACNFLRAYFLPMMFPRGACDLLQASFLPIMFARGACDFLQARFLPNVLALATFFCQVVEASTCTCLSCARSFMDLGISPAMFLFAPFCSHPRPARRQSLSHL